MSMRNLRRLMMMAALLVVAAPAFAAGPFRFYPLTPCRIIDTRAANAPVMNAGDTRSFKVRDNVASCGVPSDAQAVAFNVTVFSPSAKGHVRVFPSDIPMPYASTLNFAGGENAVANGAIVPMPATTGTTTDISVYLFMVSAGSGHFIGDVTGYFK
jgi:hypothetical protein